MSRETEVANVEDKPLWLAQQLDEVSADVQSRLIGQAEEMREVKAELAGIRGVLTKLLLSLIGALVAVPIALWVFILNHGK